MKRTITISLAIFTIFALSFTTIAQNRADKLRADGYNPDGTRVHNQVSADDLLLSGDRLDI